jgi:hypothetical protein
MFRGEVLGLIPGRYLEILKVTYSFCMHSAALGSTQPLTEMRNFLWGKMWPAHTADNSAILVVPNAKSKDGSPTFHPPSESS